MGKEVVIEAAYRLQSKGEDADAEGRKFVSENAGL